MLTRLLIGASLPLVLGAGVGDWKTFAPKEGGFSILFPGTPTENKEKSKTPAGDVAVTYFVLEKGGITFVASFTEFPKDSMKVRTEEKRLDNARDGASAKGKLLSERKFKVDKYPSRELMIQAENRIVRTRLVAVDNRLFQTMVMGTKKQATSKDAGKFLDSFRLAKK